MKQEERRRSKSGRGARGLSNRLLLSSSIYIIVDLVKRGVFTIVGEMQHYRNNRYSSDSSNAGPGSNSGALVAQWNFCAHAQVWTFSLKCPSKWFKTIYTVWWAGFTTDDDWWHLASLPLPRRKTILTLKPSVAQCPRNLALLLIRRRSRSRRQTDKHSETVGGWGGSASDVSGSRSILML